MTGAEWRTRRTRLGLTQTQMAILLNTSQSCIAELEREIKQASPEFEARLLTLPPVSDLCGACLCVVAAGICGCREAW
jgi:hypothetical protein